MIKLPFMNGLGSIYRQSISIINVGYLALNKSVIIADIKL